VACALTFEVATSTGIVLQVAPALRGSVGLSEHLEVVNDGVRLVAEEWPGSGGGRQHIVHARPGVLNVTYQATTTLGSQPAAELVTVAERVEALRPSRYCASDRLTGFARGHFELPGAATRVRAICDYVWSHTVYTPGASGPTSDAVDTLVSGLGVCRDFAHLVAALCRAVEVPARVAAVYAPGLWAMDLHAVVETEIDGVWRVWDPTRLAPRASMVRIATGRDAADVAFATLLHGQAALTNLFVQAIAADDLPPDDHESLAVLR
jgi:transglutaminase-like putative cysteine protease